ncbi:MAG: cyclic nucleotide-binding domain-containing protein [Chloroflexi bacterium]|nr:cyclic nucleotide-binding domain-containing protein [Chloroflexota bacterium]
MANLHLEILKEIPFFQGLSEADLDHIISTLEEQVFPADVKLIDEQSPGETCYIIIEGEVEILRYADGYLMRLTTRGPGETVGEMALLEGNFRSATVRTLAETRMLVLSRNVFETLTNQYGRVALNLSKELTRRLRETDARLMTTLDELRLRLATQDEQKVHEIEQQVLSLKMKVAELQTMQMDVALELVDVIEIRDPYLSGHAQRVRAITYETSFVLGWEREKLRQMELAALLHDVGNLIIPDAVFSKRDELTPQEWILVRSHPVRGAAIVRAMRLGDQCADFIKYHHETYNGTGYPNHLRGEEIPDGARILGLAEAYDAIISKRSYHPNLAHHEAVKVLRMEVGTRWDPAIFDAFVYAIERATQR